MYNLFIFIYLFFTHTLSPMVQMTHTFVNFCKNKKVVHIHKVPDNICEKRNGVHNRHVQNEVVVIIIIIIIIMFGL